MSNSRVEQCTTSMTVGPTEKPGQGLSTRRYKDPSNLEFSASFEIAGVLKALAAIGYIEIKKLMEGRGSAPDDAV